MTINCSFAAFLGASFISSPAAEPSSFVLLDQVVMHTGNQQLYQNWDFNMGHKTPANAPTNWLAPESPLFDHGIYHWRVEVRRMERPWTSPMSVQFGWWNITGDPEIRHIASPLLILANLTPPAPGQPWVYEQVGTVKSLDRRHMYYGKGPDADKNALDWDWRRAFAPNSGYTLVNPLENKLDGDGDGKITEAEYPDLEYRSVVTIHWPGSPLYESLNLEARRMTAGGGFELQTLDTTIVNPWLKTVGDVDGDGRTDIVVGGAIRGGLVVYLNRFPAWERQVVDASRKFGTDGEAADLDGDGRNDIVAITIGPDTLTWYRNTSSGWTPQVLSDKTVHDVEVADFDGDGHPDIVARNQKEWPAGDDAGQRLHFFWQKRKGANLSWESSTLDCPPGEGLLAIDLDGDGDRDLVVNGVWFENLGQRRWQKHVFAKAEDWSHANTFIATGDFNGDGRRDLVFAPSELKGHRYHITWFEAPADLRTDGWRAHVAVPDVETVCHFVGAADFDGDGRTDIAYAHMPQGADPENVRVLFNRGHQDGAQWRDTWEPLTLSEAGSHSMRVLDADGDGRPDLFGANWKAEGRDEHVKLWLNRLHTGKRVEALPLDRWRRHVIDEANPWPAAFVGAVDLDGDGKPDVVAGGSWYRNPGSASGKWERLAVGEPFNNFAGAFDLDGDGDIDLFGTAWKGKGASSQLVWARNDGGRFTVLTNIARPDGREDFLQGIAFGRFQQQGLQVALSWHNGTGNGVQLLGLPADPSRGQWSWQRLPYPDQQEQLTAADLDGDGRLDVVLGTRWLRNRGRDWQDLKLNDNPRQVDRNRVGDLDGDGRLDVVIGYQGISQTAPLAWYSRGDDATKPWTEHLIADDVVGAMSLDLADMDGDGDLDVIIGEHNLKQPEHASVIIFENLGRGQSWKRHIVYTGDEHHDGTQVVDIDGDGDLDIVSIGWGHRRVLLYENLAIQR